MTKVKDTNTNPAAIEWPVDPTGRTTELKKALVGLADVRSVDTAKLVLKVLEIGTTWFPERVKANKAAEEARAARREQREEAERIRRAELALEGKRHEAHLASEEAKRLAKEVKEMEELTAKKED